MQVWICRKDCTCILLRTLPELIIQREAHHFSKRSAKGSKRRISILLPSAFHPFASPLLSDPFCHIYLLLAHSDIIFCCRNVPLASGFRLRENTGLPIKDARLLKYFKSILLFYFPYHHLVNHRNIYFTKLGNRRILREILYIPINPCYINP